MTLAQKVRGPAPAFETARVAAAQTTAIGILFAVSGSHMLNDMMQSLAPALYPVFRDTYSLSFFQTGLITLVFQVTASLLQPFIGMFTDRRPVPWGLPSAMAFTMIGLILLAFSVNYRDAARLGRPDWRRQRDFPSRGLARRPRRRPEGGMASRRACSRSAAISASRWGR